MLCSKVASWAADTTPGIEETETWAQLHLSGQFLRRFAATDMKLVEGRKITMSQMCQVFSRLRQGLKDGIFQPSTCVVARDVRLYAHASLQSGEVPLVRGSVVGFEGGELFFPCVAGGLQKADAAVPSEDGIVVARGTDFFGFAEAVEGAADQGSERVRGLAGMKLGLGAAFEKQAGVIEALVGVGEFREGVFRIAVAVAGTADELVGDGQAQEAKGQLLLRVRRKDIAADGFGFLRLVEVAVELGLGDRFGDSALRDGSSTCIPWRPPALRQTEIGPCDFEAERTKNGAPTLRPRPGG